MADAQTVYAKTLDAMNESSDLAGVQRFPDQIAALQAQLAALQTQLVAAGDANQVLQNKINAAKAAAQADMDADNANLAGQGVLNALN